MENKEEVDVQEFFGEEYFLVKSVIDENKKYDAFAKVSNPTEILLVENVKEGDEEGYKVITGDKFLEVMSLFKQGD